jgi:hypothetical protein
MLLVAIFGLVHFVFLDAGYFSTTARIKDKRTPLEATLANVGSLETLELLEKVTKNSAVQPAEEKFRRLKLRWGYMEGEVLGLHWRIGRAGQVGGLQHRFRCPDQCSRVGKGGTSAACWFTTRKFNFHACASSCAARSNSKIRSLIVEIEGGLEAMAALGWQQVQEDGEEVLTLAKGAATMAQVRCILEAQQEFKKNDRQLKRTKSSASLPGSEEQAALRAQIEADRLERATRSPVTADSVAQALPGEGARIATAKDCGIKCEC